MIQKTVRFSKAHYLLVDCDVSDDRSQKSSGHLVSEHLLRAVIQVRDFAFECALRTDTPTQWST